MKTWGTKAQGKKAQYESFFARQCGAADGRAQCAHLERLGSAVPCWAKELGSVCVVAGPIYDDAAHLRHIQERRTRTGS